MRKLLFAISSFLKQNWGDGKRTDGSPIKYSVPFEIFIVEEQVQFNISIDGKQFCDFIHRASVAYSKYLVKEGDARISFIGIGEDPTYFDYCKLPIQDQQLEQQEHQDHENCIPPKWKGYPILK